MHKHDDEMEEIAICMEHMPDPDIMSRVMNNWSRDLVEQIKELGSPPLSGKLESVSEKLLRIFAKEKLNPVEVTLILMMLLGTTSGVVGKDLKSLGQIGNT